MIFEQNESPNELNLRKFNDYNSKRNYYLQLRTKDFYNREFYSELKPVSL